MKFKYAKARQQGMHNFNRHSTPVDYVTMRNLQEYPNPPKEYQDKFERIEPQKFNQEDSERIFVYGEYLKRKFYLDCYYTSIKPKKNYRYTRNIFNSNEECRNYIENIFILNEDKLNFDIKKIYGKDKFICSFERFGYNIYKTIESYFHISIDKIRKFISNPEEYSHSKYITDDDIFFLKNLNPITDYYCERILYNVQPLSMYKPYNIKYQENKFSNTLRIINNVLDSNLDDGFLMLYKYIIDKYSLYMTDLFKLTSIDNIICNHYTIQNLSHFFFIPIKINDDEFIRELININTDEINHNINIDIKLISNLDSLQIANYVYGTLLNALFFYKENKEMTYSMNEIAYFIKMIDSKNKHNKITFNSRIHGLYIWDQKYIYNKQSIRSISINFIKKFMQQDEGTEDAKIKYLFRCYNGTLNSIEMKSFCQLK
ncbi:MULTISPECIES: hypothetical protein [unclassified Desulfovibrio]|uniref:hypothetical protein n=1 Tax=unclassified Desulfovibrio TaxID=2593640 RepID=UPI0013EE0D40|nr:MULTISPECIES: hypothetical protein [unclassified Desulfovibrio]